MSDILIEKNIQICWIQINPKWNWKESKNQRKVIHSKIRSLISINGNE